MIKEDALIKAMETWRKADFVWGKSDCMLLVADYLNDIYGVDCATRYRGKYSTRSQCYLISGAHIDPVKPFKLCVDELGLIETKTPVRGDVGVIDTGIIMSGAICLGETWAAKAPSGVTFGKPARILKAWCVDAQ